MKNYFALLLVFASGAVLAGEPGAGSADISHTRTTFKQLAHQYAQAGERTRNDDLLNGCVAEVAGYDGSPTRPGHWSACQALRRFHIAHPGARSQTLPEALVSAARGVKEAEQAQRLASLKAQVAELQRELAW